MLGIKSDDLSAINGNDKIININKEEDNEKIEDRHYAPDFM